MKPMLSLQKLCYESEQDICRAGSGKFPRRRAAPSGLKIADDSKPQEVR